MAQSDDTGNTSGLGSSPGYIPGNTGGGTRPTRPPTEKNASEQRLATAAEGSVLPHVYGRVQIGGKIFAVGHDTTYWYLGVAWCIGGTRGISEIEKVFNGEEEVLAADRQDYLGKPFQDTFYNSAMTVAGGEEVFGMSGQSRNWLHEHINGYSDKMVSDIMDSRVGIAYSVIRVAFSSTIGNIVGQVNGFKVKDYASGSVPDTDQPVAEPLDLVNGWENHHQWSGDAKYFAMKDGSVFIQGLVKNGMSAQSPVAFLPKQLAPVYHRMASTYTSPNPARVDVRRDGAIVSPWNSDNGGFDTAWASITVDYCADDTGWVPLTYLNGWAAYPASAGYRTLSYKVMDDGRVYIEGMVSLGTIDSPMANLPPQLSPPGGLIFSCRTHGGSDCRVDVIGTEIIARSGATWIHVSICYYPDNEGWTSLPLLGNWENFGGSWQSAQYKKMPSGIVAVRGRVKNAAFQASIAQLPVGYRSSAAIVTCKIDGTGTGKRVDYSSTGIIANPSAPYLDPTYVSLTQLFVASSEQWAYVDSTNPSNALADHITSKAYGVGGDIGSTETTTECVDYNNEYVIVDDLVAAGTPPNDTLRHEIGYAMERIDDVTKYAEVLRNYANCFVQYFGASVYMISDRKIAGSGTAGALATTDFSAVFDDSNVVRDSIKMKKSGDRNHPTVVRVTYSERTPSAAPVDGIHLWGSGSVVKYFNDSISEVTHWKEARLSFPGIPTKSQATRKAIEYMNHLWLEDLDVQFDTFGEAITLHNGSPFLLKHYLGIGTDLQEIEGYKPFRCVKAVLVGPNKYRVYGKEYQPDAYSNVIDITPSIPDTNLPDPTKPIEILGLSVTERSVYDGSRYYTVFDVVISVDEDNPRKNWQSYSWQLLEKGAVIDKGTQLDDLTFTTKDLKPDTVYTITVTATNVTSSKVGIPFVITAYALGKDAPPSEPNNLTAEEYGETIFLEWDDADDEFPVRKYELRKMYNPVQATPHNGETAEVQWEFADPENKVGASGYVKTGALKGVYRFFVKSIDVFGTYSKYPAYVEISVTSDNSSFVKDRWSYQVTSTSPGMHLYKPRKASPYTIAFNCATTSFASMITSNLASYTQKLYLYYPAGYNMSNTGLLRLGDPERSPTDFWPIQIAAKLTGSFESVIEQYEAPDYYLNGIVQTGDGRFLTITNETSLSQGGSDVFHHNPNIPFKATAKTIRGWVGGTGAVKLRVDTAYLKASFIPRKEHGVITTVIGVGETENVVELESTYYAAYKLNTQVFVNNSSLTHGGDNLSMMADPFQVSGKTDISTNNGTSSINSTATDFVAAGFTSANETNADVTNFIRLQRSDGSLGSGLYKLISVSPHQLLVSPAPPTEASGDSTSVAMVNTVTIFCRNYILGHEVAREVHWFFEGV